MVSLIQEYLLALYFAPLVPAHVTDRRAVFLIKVKTV